MWGYQTGKKEKKEHFLVRSENVGAVRWMEGPVGSIQHSSKASSGPTAIVCEEESYQWISARLGLPTVPSVRLPVLPQEFFRGV